MKAYQGFSYAYVFITFLSTVFPLRYLRISGPKTIASGTNNSLTLETQMDYKQFVLEVEVLMLSMIPFVFSYPSAMTAQF